MAISADILIVNELSSAAAYTSNPTSDREWMSIQIETAMAGFDADPKVRHRLRNLARDYPELFVAAALTYLQSDQTSPGDAFIVTLLMRQDSVFERLTDPVRFSCERAVGIFKRLLSLDPTLDFRLARMLPGRNDSSAGKPLAGKHAARAIDILERTSQGQRLLSLLGHLPNSADPHISAKAALFLSRRMNNPAWIEKQMNREDARVRANALEGAWGATSCLRVLEDSLSDSNNRVAGNALIGLHLAGCGDTTRLAIEMSRSDDPARRATAGWAMGRIGMAEFIPRLSELLKDQSPKVKSAAIRSLVEIGRVQTARAAAETVAAETAAAEISAAGYVPTPEPTPVPTPVPGDAPVAPPAANDPAPPETDFQLNLDGSSFTTRRKR